MHIIIFDDETDFIVCYDKDVEEAIAWVTQEGHSPDNITLYEATERSFKVDYGQVAVSMIPEEESEMTKGKFCPFKGILFCQEDQGCMECEVYWKTMPIPYLGKTIEEIDREEIDASWVESL